MLKTQILSWCNWCQFWNLYLTWNRIYNYIYMWNLFWLLSLTWNRIYNCTVFIFLYVVVSIFDLVEVMEFYLYFFLFTRKYRPNVPTKLFQFYFYLAYSFLLWFWTHWSKFCLFFSRGGRTFREFQLLALKYERIHSV